MAVAANKRSVMTLFSSATDMASHQVRIVLAEKGVAVEVELVDEANLPAELVELNPYKSVPTLVDRELTLYDSKIIMEYLDERFPHPPLMPVYPVDRGKNRLMMYRIQRNWYSVAEKIISTTGEEQEKARQKLRNDLLMLGPLFAESEYFMSEDFSLIDCYLAPLLWRLPTFGIELTGPGSKELKIYMNRVFERDSFLASLTEAEREMRLVR
ncbi:MULTISPECIES: stringent starvation protein SspA [Vibrio]|uniref:Stringent starvation protein A n=2 Tax=Vibrio TaxID=662 RepID=U3B5F5_9VIBR|nr:MULTISPECIES: stringent starvation protein SspA [Vibrio]MPW36870.1 stringent starvation protein A [Vibrio sp. B1Z05]GAD80667.1 stringent starvation protein A [Vibrio ezurae NBRC 102218]GAD88205.1 stringent starvation protein A [Vibrio halioticoli NBRC 102217]